MRDLRITEDAARRNATPPNSLLLALALVEASGRMVTPLAGKRHGYRFLLLGHLLRMGRLFLQPGGVLHGLRLLSGVPFSEHGGGLGQRRIPRRRLWDGRDIGDGLRWLAVRRDGGSVSFLTTRQHH